MTDKEMINLIFHIDPDSKERLVLDYILNKGDFNVLKETLSEMAYEYNVEELITQYAYIMIEHNLCDLFDEHPVYICLYSIGIEFNSNFKFILNLEYYEETDINKYYDKSILDEVIKNIDKLNTDLESYLNGN